MRTRRFLGGCVLALAWAGGDVADIPPQDVTRQLVGPTGATIAAPSESSIAGSRITVPPGALDRETEVAVFSAPDQCPNLPAGLVDLSAPADFLPIAVPFGHPAVVRIGLPESHMPFFARHDGTLHPRLLAEQASLFAVGDSGWEELPVVRRSDTWLETSVDVLVHGCFLAVVQRGRVP